MKVGVRDRMEQSRKPLDGRPMVFHGSTLTAQARITCILGVYGIEPSFP
jgi:hypothetical protein